MAQLRTLVLSSAFTFFSFASLAATGVFREQVIPGAIGGATQLIRGPDGGSWFTEFTANSIGAFSPDGQFRRFQIPTVDSGPHGIAWDVQAVWFTELKACKIGRLSLDGAFREYPIPSPSSAPWGITVISGIVWFTESGTNKIGRVNLDGSVSEFPIPTADSVPRGIAGLFQPCFAEFAANRIACVENDLIVERVLPNPNSGPQDVAGMTNAADVWFTESTGNRIGVAHFSGVASLGQALIEDFPVPTAASGLESPLTTTRTPSGSAKRLPGRSAFFGWTAG